jgi:hypothetical protein
MKNRLAIGSVIAVATVVSVLWAQAPANPAQAVAPAGGSQNADTQKAKGKGGGGKGRARITGPTPRLADGHPDLVGMWNGGGPVGDLMQGQAEKEAPLSEIGKMEMAKRQSKDDPEANCLPTGVPRQAPYPWRIVTDPTHIYMLFEGNIHSFRQIFMDGRKHPADPDPSWYGHSIGSWDGDTLVVDTVGYNDKFWFDFRGHPHSEQLHTIERWTRKDLGTLENVVTIDDPVMYSKKFDVKYTATLRQNDELMEYICQENQQDAQHLQGNAGLP